jgi:hypothetical protein
MRVLTGWLEGLCWSFGGGGWGGEDFSSHSFTCRLPPTWVFANRRLVYGELLDESLAAPTAFYSHFSVQGERIEK